MENDEGMVEDSGDDNDEIDEYLQFSEQQERERSTAVQSKYELSYFFCFLYPKSLYIKHCCQNRPYLFENSKHRYSLPKACLH